MPYPDNIINVIAEKYQLNKIAEERLLKCLNIEGVKNLIESKILKPLDFIKISLLGFSWRLLHPQEVHGIVSLCKNSKILSAVKDKTLSIEGLLEISAKLKDSDRNKSFSKNSLKAIPTCSPKLFSCGKKRVITKNPIVSESSTIDGIKP